MAERTLGDWDIGGGSIAENYERYLVPWIFAPIARDFLDIVQPQAGDHVLDVACGSGVVARLAAERVGPDGRVVGLDLQPDMVDQARSLAQTSPPVQWEQASADNMPFPDETFTVVLCQQSLPFFPDKSAALREMRRVTARGGRLGLNVLGHISGTPVMAALAEALTRHIGPGPAGFVQLVASLPSEAELRSLVEAAGFEEVTVSTVSKEMPFPSAAEFVRRYLLSTPLAANPQIRQADDSVRAAVAEEVSSRLQPYAGQRGVVAAPAEIIMVTARR